VTTAWSLVDLIPEPDEALCERLVHLMGLDQEERTDGA